jgi:hypothetical protein
MSNRDKNPKTLIRIRPWLEAKRRPGDGMWALWYLGTVELEPRVDDTPVETYTGWVQINTARNVRTLLDTAPADYMPKESRASGAEAQHG